MIPTRITDALLQRNYTEQGTYGTITTKQGSLPTLELPYLNNQTNISCIPPGIYQCNWINSSSLGWCYEVADVYKRTYIRIHTGNYTSQIEGCILVGLSCGDINGDGELDVGNSRDALNLLYKELGDSFSLQIL